MFTKVEKVILKIARISFPKIDLAHVPEIFSIRVKDAMIFFRKLKLTRVLWVKAHTHDQRDMFLALCMLKSFHLESFGIIQNDSESFRSGFWFNHWLRLNLLSNCYEMITCNFITESKLIKKFDLNTCQCSRTVKFFRRIKKI